MRRLLIWFIALGIVGLVGFWGLTRPQRLPDSAMADLQGDPDNGALVFFAGGCASCHSAENAPEADRLILSGGQRFASPFGTFLAPNISPDPDHGIGNWSALDLANAMRHGVSPQGAHYYPAFPYTSYAHASLQDLADLYAYMKTLPASDIASQPHDISFPFNIRRGLGLWKRLFTNKGWVMTGDLSDKVARGRYLVEGLGHCSECHTPRNPIGGLQRDRWLAGAPTPDGKDKVPNITPARLSWNATDIAYYLETGFTPDFDAAGGHMASVVLNTGQLPASDRAAIAAYLGAVPAVE